MCQGMGGIAKKKMSMYTTVQKFAFSFFFFCVYVFEVYFGH